MGRACCFACAEIAKTALRLAGLVALGSWLAGWLAPAWANAGRAATSPANAGSIATTVAPQSRPASASAGCRPVTEPGTDRVELQIPGQSAFCWVHRPVGYAPGQRLPLMICLHGTDDTAEQMVEFWRQRRMRWPTIIVAPQGVGQGWSSEDVPRILATFDYARDCLWHDPNRVLLAGFSAGGVMTFQMLYNEKVPATAAAALANYVPPRLTLEQVRERRLIPVFYAVGMKDVNHELMRSGLDFLRAAGANVELYRPPIGHTLDPDVAQAAMDWFFDQCVKQTEATIDAAARGQPVGPAVERLEQIVSQAAWHPPATVERAKQVIERLEQEGVQMVRSADSLAAANRPGEAVELFKRVESVYGMSRLGMQARTKRERLESDPATRERVEQHLAAQRARQAMAEYARAQRLVAQNRLPDAAEVCRQIMTSYPDTPAALRADRLLTLINGRTTP
ncbi:MAG TPA: hypothetical protein PLQ89_07810 [Phycisphaerae bacterium]|nr:hypothetical protein [Phycisphaerae bacterium]HOM50905.1 hypothetical protein [Phycisphaerae bacterium]HOQ85610.1 hypothetical protein [Phycisphaerae bacterium]HPP25920.1 hypothetical protein [Phycisphaerae bacterium]